MPVNILHPSNIEKRTDSVSVDLSWYVLQGRGLTWGVMGATSRVASSILLRMEGSTLRRTTLT